MSRKIFVCLLCVVMLGSHLCVFAQSSYSDWAEKEICYAQKCGVLTEENDWDYQKSITRGELAPILLRAYENVTQQEAPKAEKPYFSDGSYEASALYELGIMNGIGDNLFSPETFVTREQISKIILTLQAVCNGEKLTLPPAYYNPLTDFSKVSDWAKPYVEQAYNEGIVTGYEDGSFRGQNTVSREEAVVLLVRSVSLQEITKPTQKPAEKPSVYEQDTAITEISTILSWDVEFDHESGEKTIVWSRLPNGTEYVLKITEQRNSRYEGDIPPNELEYRYTDTYSHTLYLYPNRTYHISLEAENYLLETEFYVPRLVFEDMSELSETVPQTKEEAEEVMTEITVPVWKMKSDGTKYESSLTVTVHSAISDKVTAIFTEIFEGDEQFPIRDLGGYSWRGGRSEHNWGTAIDLNANENYCIYKDGTTVGECWAPYENPYSITPYGDVVNAFEKYGFTWGGDAWSNPKDYMHFSYLGT